MCPFGLPEQDILDKFFRKFEGQVEVDETFVGGKTRQRKAGRGSERKTPVVALIERGGDVRTKITKDTSISWIDSRSDG